MQKIIENLLKLQNVELGRGAKAAEKQTQIDELRAIIPAPILGHYDRLRARDKKGVAIVQNGVCCECHMRLPIGTFATLVHGDDIQLCGTCGRYLFLPEDAVVPGLAKPEAAPKPRRRERKVAAHAI